MTTHKLRARETSSKLALRILATTDLHACLMPFDYCADTPVEATGLVRTASLIRKARAEVANCILLDNGDFVQGSALGDFVAEASLSETAMIHPVIGAMNALGYDAGTLGNHEFSYGLPVLHRMLKAADFPIVSANMLHHKGTTPDQDQPLTAPFVVLERNVTDDSGLPQFLKIGIIGVAPPQVLIWDHPHVAGRLQVRDMVDATAAAIPRVQHAGADIIVVLAHTGFGTLPYSKGSENAGLAIAALPGVDALVLGHAHQVFPSSAFASTDLIDPVAGCIMGKAAMMPGMFGSHLGVMDLTLTKTRGKWHVQTARAETRPIAARDFRGRAIPCTQDDPEIRALAAPSHTCVQAWMQKPVGYSAASLHSYFALVTDSAMLRVVAHAQTMHLQRLLAQTSHVDLPVISAAAPFKVGGRAGPDHYTDVPEGPLQLRHASDLYTHPNNFTALLVTGADVATWLERAVSIFHQIAPGRRDAALINPAIPHFAMEMLAGVTYSVDLSQPARYDARGALLCPAASRICDLRFEGRPVNATMRFALATNSYRAWVYAAQSETPVQVLVEGAEPMRDVIVSHLSRAGNLPAMPPPGWHLAPMPGTTVTLDTSPRAIAHMADIASFRPEPLGLTSDGFQRFRLHL